MNAEHEPFRPLDPGTDPMMAVSSGLLSLAALAHELAGQVEDKAALLTRDQAVCLTVDVVNATAALRRHHDALSQKP